MKAGEDNSVVSVHVYDLTTGTTVRMDTGEETDIYIRYLQQNLSDIFLVPLNIFITFAAPNGKDHSYSSSLTKERERIFYDYCTCQGR